MAKDSGKGVTIKRRIRTQDDIARVLAKRQLTMPQRLAIHALVLSTTRNEALELLSAKGFDVDKSTLSRWMARPHFRESLAMAEAAIAESITRNSVLRKSEAALEVAMKGTPILGYVGKDEQEIVGYKPDLPSAARLIEIQGKAVGAFGDDGATKIAILVDVDFSGRKEAPVDERPVIDVEPERDDSWLD